MKDIKLLCPYCKNNVFNRTTIERVNIIDTGEGLSDEFVDNIEGDTYVCSKCSKDVTEDELVRPEVKA